jgi:AAA ATPase domain
MELFGRAPNDCRGRVGLPFPETALLNAFRPGNALDEPSLFAGRRDQVIALAQNLHIDGVCPIIYGASGLGKSRLAHQARLIAMGDVRLLEDYEEPQWAFGEDDAYLPFYVQCSASMQDTRSILQSVINSFRDAATNESTEPSRLVDRTTTRRISLKPFEISSAKRYQPPDKSPTYDDLAIDEKLRELSLRLSDAYGRPILVIIDELDLVRDTSGLASFITRGSRFRATAPRSCSPVSCGGTVRGCHRNARASLRMPRHLAILSSSWSALVRTYPTS